MEKDAKKLVQKQYSAHAAGYVSSESHARGDSLSRLVEVTQPKSDWRVLDIATGGGHTALAFAPHVHETWSTDLTLPMLYEARTFIARSALTGKTVYFAGCDAETLPFAEGTFDLVTCRIAPHHFPDVRRFVQECARVLKPEGLCAVVDIITPPEVQTAKYVNAFEQLRDPSHVWAYSLVDWEAFFFSAGLPVFYHEPAFNRQNLTQWAVRMGCAPEVITRLQVMLVQAPEPVSAWLKPEIPVAGSGEAIHFTIQQALILGRKQ